MSAKVEVLLFRDGEKCPCCGEPEWTSTAYSSYGNGPPASGGPIGSESGAHAAGGRTKSAMSISVLKATSSLTLTSRDGVDLKDSG